MEDLWNCPELKEYHTMKAKFNPKTHSVTVEIPCEAPSTMCKGTKVKPSSNYKIASSGGNQPVLVDGLGVIKIGLNMFCSEDVLSDSSGT